MLIQRKKIVITSITSILLLAFPSTNYAQKDDLKTNIEKIVKSSKSDIGIAIESMEDKYTYSFNGTKHFPMESVYKFPIAMAVLNQVDTGKLSLSQKIHITKAQMHKTHSPIRDKYPNGNVDLTIADLLKNMVSFSDNNACDILLNVVGGPEKVESYIHSLGVKGIAIKTSEYEMSKTWNGQFENWSEPNDMLQLLKILSKGTALSKSSNDFLMKSMRETSTGPNRIKGLLPKGTVVAHKTGTSGTNAKGITAGINDVGIVTMPNGKHFAIVVFISNSSDSTKNIESTIAKVTKLTWDKFYSKK